MINLSNAKKADTHTHSLPWDGAITCSQTGGGTFYLHMLLIRVRSSLSPVLFVLFSNASLSIPLFITSSHHIILSYPALIMRAESLLVFAV